VGSSSGASRGIQVYGAGGGISIPSSAICYDTNDAMNSMIDMLKENTRGQTLMTNPSTGGAVDSIKEEDLNQSYSSVSTKITSKDHLSSSGAIKNPAKVAAKGKEKKTKKTSGDNNNNNNNDPDNNNDNNDDNDNNDNNNMSNSNKLIETPDAAVQSSAQNNVSLGNNPQFRIFGFIEAQMNNCPSSSSGKDLKRKTSIGNSHIFNKRPNNSNNDDNNNNNINLDRSYDAFHMHHVDNSSASQSLGSNDTNETR
jgi:hypothetical protein